jgi:hypothetical protein
MTPGLLPALGLESLLGAAPALVLGAGAASIPLHGRRWLGLAAFAAGLAAAPWLNAALPVLSFTLIALSALRLFAPDVKFRVGTGVLAALVPSACLFYAMALGWGPFDPYDLGFQARELVVALAALGLILAAAGEGAALTLLAASLLAYAAGLYANLWDALIDPVLILLALAALMSRARNAALRR